MTSYFNFHDDAERFMNCKLLLEYPPQFSPSTQRWFGLHIEKNLAYIYIVYFFFDTQA